MKKTLLYISLLLIRISLGLLLLISVGLFNKKDNTLEQSFLLANLSDKEKKLEFIQSAARLLGESIIVQGTVEEVYKNSNNEVVLYLSDNNIPLVVNCTLNNSNMQVNEPFKLGETINLQGVFTRLHEEMHLESCLLINRFPMER